MISWPDLFLTWAHVKIHFVGKRFVLIILTPSGVASKNVSSIKNVLEIRTAFKGVGMDMGYFNVMRFGLTRCIQQRFLIFCEV